jgi:hypothetical protein
MKPSTLLPIILGITSAAAFAQAPMTPPVAPPEQGTIDLRQPAAPSRTPASNAAPGSIGADGSAPVQNDVPSQSSGQSAIQSPDQAGSGMPDPQPGTAGPPDLLPQPDMMEAKREGGFTYVCGGVGEQEAARMKNMAGDYDMMLTFATRKGAYLADVNVDIKESKGRAELQAMCGGPIMLVDVPHTGTYQVHAEAGGYTLNQTARVTANRRNIDALVMHWPTQIGETIDTAQTSTGASGTESAGSTGGPQANAAAGESSGGSGGDIEREPVGTYRIEHPSGILETVTPMDSQ